MFPSVLGYIYAVTDDLVCVKGEFKYVSVKGIIKHTPFHPAQLTPYLGDCKAFHDLITRISVAWESSFLLQVCGPQNNQ